jgi:hypothetical protein
MVGTWYVKVSKKYVYELPNPCNLSDLNRAVGYMSSQLVARKMEQALIGSAFTITADEEHVYVEVELAEEREMLGGGKFVTGKSEASMIDQIFPPDEDTSKPGEELLVDRLVNAGNEQIQTPPWSTKADRSHREESM